MENRQLLMNDFKFHQTDIVLSITIPLLEKDEHMFAYKQSYRRDDDICIVSATIKVKIDEETNTIKEINLSYSNLSSFPKRAKLTEKYLKNKEFNVENIKKAYSYIFNLIFHSMNNHQEVILNLENNLHAHFYLDFSIKLRKNEGNLMIKSATEIIEHPLSKAGLKTHVNENGRECKRTYDSMMTVERQIHNIYAEKNSTGEVTYTQDIPLPPGGIYASVVMSTIPHGKIKKTDFSKCLQMHGVFDIVTYKDVKGINLVGDAIMDEPVFAEEEVQYVGQAIALVLAEDNETAWKAVKLAEI